MDRTRIYKVRFILLLSCSKKQIIEIYGFFSFSIVDNRGFPSYQDDRITSVLSTLAGTFKDITESPYFPKMAFKKIPSSKNKINIFL